MTRSRDLADSADKDISGTLTVDDLTASGEALIGTSTSPSSSDVKLAINSSGGGFAQFNFNGGAGSAIGSPAASTQAFYTTTGNIGSDVYTERMRIDSSGRVMIGTTTEGNPAAENLTIADSGHAGITIRSTDNTSSRIYFSDATSGTGEYTGYFIYDHSNNHMSIATGATERIRIGNSGYIGLNNSNPGFPLHIKGSTNTNAVLAVESANWTAGASAELRLAYVGGYNRSIKGHHDDGLLFYTNQTDPAIQIKADARTIVKAPSTATNPSFKIENTTGNNTFNHSAELFAPSLASTATNLMVIGKEGNNYNSAWLGYQWSSNASQSDNKLTFGHWGANHLWTMNANGHIQIANQPCFLVRAATTHSLGSGWQDVNYNVIVSQKGGSNFSTSNFRFTAPVNGFYQFNAQWTASGNADQDGTLSLCINGSTSNLAGSSSMSDTGYYDAHVVSGACYLSANDYMQVKRYSTVSNTTRGTYPYGGWFSGFLIG